MLLGLTSQEVGLAAVAGIFIVFSLVVALVIPRGRPDFPGLGGRKWFIVVSIALCVATLAAVEVFGAEPEEEPTGEAVTHTQPTETETTPATTQQAPAPPAGDAVAGKAVFDAQGCASCHTFAAANASGTVGPNLDEALSGKDAEFVHESIVEPDAEIAQGFPPGVMPQDYGSKLSAGQIDDLVAFLTSSSN